MNADIDQKTGRIIYLDAVRAFAMFFGIFVHGSTIANPYIDQMPLFFWLQTALLHKWRDGIHLVNPA